MTTAIPVAREAGADTFFKLAFAMGVLVVGLEVGYLLHSPLPYDPVGYLVGRDFVNTWLGAQLALTGDPGTHFGVDAYNALLAERFSGEYPLHIWSYPPQLLLFTWPWGLMPYMPAYILHCVLGLALYLAVVTDGQRRPDHLLLLILAPAVTVNIWCGQNGFLIAALLVGGLIQLDRRPVLAGVLFGLLSIKPQLGVLLPVMLVLTGRWRTIAAAAATIAVLFAATTFVFGWKVWSAYVNDAMPTQARVFLKDFEHFMTHMPTAFMGARVAGVLADDRRLGAGRGVRAHRDRRGMDVLAPARARSLQRAVRHRDLPGDALCLQLRHGRVRLGGDQADGPGRQ
jgi:Glycosyltransferase family 87